MFMIQYDGDDNEETHLRSCNNCSIEHDQLEWVDVSARHQAAPFTSSPFHSEQRFPLVIYIFHNMASGGRDNNKLKRLFCELRKNLNGKQ